MLKGHEHRAPRQPNARSTTWERESTARLRYVSDLLVAAGVDPVRADWRSNLYYRALIGEFAYRSTGGKPLAPEALEEAIDSLLLAKPERQ